jgi:arabinofuranosyltransferase
MPEWFATIPFPHQRSNLFRTASWCLGVLLPLAVCTSAAWLADDAYISLRWVHNYWTGHGFYWNPGERVMVSSHPLWLGLLWLCGALPWRIEWSTFGVSLLISAMVLSRLHRSGPVPGLLLTLSPIFVDFSCSGLENPLVHLLLVLLAQQNANAKTSHTPLLSAGLLLARPDLVPLLTPLLMPVLVKHPRTTLLSLTPLILYLVFAFVWFGTFTPNPALAKLGAGLGPSELVPKGLVWLRSAAQFDPVGGLILLAGLLSPLPRSRKVKVGTVLQLVWIVWVGGDFMEGRFLSPLLVFNLAAIFWKSPPWKPAWILPLVAVVGLSSPRSPIRQGVHFENKELDEFAIADERGFWYQTTGLWPRLRSGRPLPTIQESVGPSVLELGAVGLDAFMAGPHVHVVDRFALTDPFLARLPCDCANAFRTGHLERKIPPGYLESLSSGTNLLHDPQQRILLDEVWLLSRAPVWSRERWLYLLHLSGPSPVAPPSQPIPPK